MEATSKRYFRLSILFITFTLAFGLTTSATLAKPLASATALEMANAIFEDDTLITAASYQTIANTAQTAVFTTTYPGFPAGNEGNYAVLSTGNAASLPNAGTFADTDYSGGNIRGDTDYDVTILEIDFTAPVGGSCLTFDVRFFSEEYPDYVGDIYNDAFIAELDATTWTTSSSTISAPNNFAHISGDPMSVNALPMSAPNGAGTAFDGITDSSGGASTLAYLAARTPLVAGPHTLYLSIFDQGDNFYDSAVFLDNLVIDNTSPCVSGVFSVDPEINIQGNNTSIIDGDTSPSLEDHTDFGNTSISSGTVDRIFTIENTGSYKLDLNGSPLVSITGTHASDFSVSTDPNTPIATSSTTTFTVTFDPSAEGVRNATINIVNSDISENPYTFDIRGTGAIDTMPPTVTSVIRADINPTATSNVNFTVTFSEAVTGVNTTDFALITTSNISSASISSVVDTGDQTSYTVTINTGSGNGTMHLNVNASGTDIQDLASNPLSGGFANGEIYNITNLIYLFRPSNAGWYFKDQFVTGYGMTGDIPVPGDYDGDGNIDIAVFRPSNGGWYVKDQFVIGYGETGDIPVPGDYDGDGDTDIAIFRPSTGSWHVKDQFVISYGSSGDIPVQGDYDGNGTSDIAVFRDNGIYTIWMVKDQFTIGYGLSGDIPIPSDYDGNGTFDIAVFRDSGTSVGWHVKDQFVTGYGLSGDIPVPADHNGDGQMDVVVFRPSNGGWYVKDQFVTGYGVNGDWPLLVRDTNGDIDPYH